MPQIADDERRGAFDHFLRRAVFFGECNESSCDGIGRPTWAALERVADERTPESVIAARAAFWYDVNGWKETAAVRRAAEVGEISVVDNTSVYHAGMVNYGGADVNDVNRWLVANRTSPGQIYRDTVLDQS